MLNLMTFHRTLAVLILFLGMHACASDDAGATYKVIRVIDGDTIELSNGEQVRLLQIDTPELTGSECYSREATKLLRDLIDQENVALLSDDNLDNRDRFNRLLRYVFFNGININVHMVKEGAAAPYFYSNQYGIHAQELHNAAEKANKEKLGLWGECPEAVLETLSPLETGSYPNASRAEGSGKPNHSCDPNYANCIPAYPPDLNCDDLKVLGIENVEILGTDVHKLDFDGDGIGCE